MSKDLSRYRHAILSSSNIAPQDEALLIERQGAFACHYAPFEHINMRAKIVLLGMTPGVQQAGNALRALRNALNVRMSDADALAKAKTTASFSGTMRGNLVAMLDHVGLQHRLGLGSCAELFTTRTDVVHFTSALRYPVFVDGKDYSGNPAIQRTPFLKELSERWLTEEVLRLPNAYWIPLGKEATAAIRAQVVQRNLHANQVLDGMPHPSGANAERIAYFLGTKAREALSTKTDASALDARRDALSQRIAAAVQVVPAPATAARPDRNHALMLPPAAAIAMPTRPAAPPRMSSADSRRAQSFYLEGYDGQPIYPVRIKGRNTGVLAFNLAPRGARTHTQAFKIEVQDEAKAYEMVASGTYKIRATIGAGVAPSLLGLGDRTVRRLVKVSPV